MKKIIDILKRIKSAFHYILNNKVYMGIYNYNGKKEKNKISFKVPPIVSNYIWNKANHTT